MPIHLRNELQVELALMRYYGLITTLSQSRYSSPLFAKRKNKKMMIITKKMKITYLSTFFTFLVIITFLSEFPWEKLALNDEQKAVVGEVLVEFSDIFAKHRFDVGYNTDLKIKLTPERNIPIYKQGPPMPIHPRNELQVELALMLYYGLITILSQARYSSPLFAQRKNSGRLRLLIDLRKVNHLLKNDYVNTNFPISNMSDAINHFAGKKLFTKLDCSQAYHCANGRRCISATASI